MYLKTLELSGFKSFAKKTELHFNTPIASIVGPNGSGKSNIAEAFRYVLGEQSIKSLRGKKGEDMIFNGSSKLARLNRASVKVVFDNSRRLLNIDFDEVSIERVVYRDSTNEYILNGSQVRLRDIVELLSQAHIGPSGHHIISQGEADKILNANIKERREMIEEALGLKIYQYKKQESERKLEKTRENMKNVENIRKEIAPHLKFLKKQVEKVEKAQALKNELVLLYKEYFKREDLYLKHEHSRIKQGIENPTKELRAHEEALKNAKKKLEESEKSDALSEEVLKFEDKLNRLRAEKDSFNRSLGRLEGEISVEDRRLKKLYDNNSGDSSKLVSLKEIEIFATSFNSNIDQIIKSESISEIRDSLSKIQITLKKFIDSHKSSIDSLAIKEMELILGKLVDEKKQIEEKIIKLKETEEQTHLQYQEIKKEIEKETTLGREAEREIFRLESLSKDIYNKIAIFKSEEDRLKIEEDEWKRELHEGTILAGRSALDYDLFELKNADGKALLDTDIYSESRTVQKDRRRNIEKVKIRIEELSGTSGEDVLKEFKETEERDVFLMREIEDLEKSATSLEELISDLNTRLDVEFKEGIKKINTQFESFFKLMFGGGFAGLTVIREKKRKVNIEDELLKIGGENPVEEEGEEGIDIEVNLPHKKIKGLEVLSGGERALTSIALLFAVSQVNPPPFIVLDETDAALDEANSRKYGDMIENLSKISQLILITHNRETMSRAGLLYGVTMSSDGVSKLLSVAFDEAVKVAK